MPARFVKRRQELGGRSTDWWAATALAGLATERKSGWQPEVLAGPSLLANHSDALLGSGRGGEPPRSTQGYVGRHAGKVTDDREKAGPEEPRRLVVVVHGYAEHSGRYEAVGTWLAERGCAVELIADEWANTLDDIRRFADAGAADFVQVKTPDLGSIHNSIEALLHCRRAGIGAYLGGSANETEHSSRICAHVALACRADLLICKPG